jgi:hypothetical protein
MAKKKENEKLSLDEEMLMWTSYRYCIGRKTYVTSLAPYIGKKYYNLLSDERSEFTSKDIKECIDDCLRFGTLSIKYDGTVSNNERDALSDLLTWFNENVSSKEDLANIDNITCYKDSYKEGEPKKYHTVKTSRFNFEVYEHDYSDLIVWHNLSSLFSKKNHKFITVNYDNKDRIIECFQVWDKCFTNHPTDKNCIKEVPWKYEKRWVSVENYLLFGEQAGYLNEEFIIKIEDNAN